MGDNRSQTFFSFLYSLSPYLARLYVPREHGKKKLENCGSEVQMYTRTHSGPRFANLRARTKTRTKARGVSSEFVKFKTHGEMAHIP